jgi:protein ImuB
VSGEHVTGSDAEPGRRVVAIVLPDLMCELASVALAVPVSSPGGERRRGAEALRARVLPPLGVLLVSEPPVKEAGEVGAPAPVARATAVLAAVNGAAEKFGVRVGQTVTEAHAFVTQLVIKEVTRDQVQARLGEIAEVALGFGPTIALEAPDTVWVDVTGAAHLAGGEEALALELGARVRALGHVVKVAVADGPLLAQAFARWGKTSREGTLVVPPAETAARVASLPVRALPIDAERASWLVRLGVLTVGGLAALPRAATAARLGDDASRVLELAMGKDDTPLVAYVPPAIPHEETTWDEPADGVSPLLFVLRGLVSRLGARLEGRGEAVQALELVVLHDAAMARHQGVSAKTAFHFELAAPLWRAEELFRVIASRLGRAELRAPAVGLRLEARAITRALGLQLSLSRHASGLGGNAARGPETLPVLVAELLTDLGKDKVGTLQLESSHRPERKSRLVPLTPRSLAAGASKKPRRTLEGQPGEPPTPSVRRATPTRMLPRAVPLDGPLRVGGTLSIDHRLYSVERLAFEQRLDAVEWWTGEPVSRDYVRVWLQGGSGGIEAIAYVDRNTGARMLQGIVD